ncbi:MAG: pilin [Patescibacteria group bacterium]
MIKRKLIVLVALLSLVVPALHLASTPSVYAQDSTPEPGVSASGCEGDAENRSILGIPTWDRGLSNCDDLDTGDVLSGDADQNPILIIANNVLIAIVSLAGIVAVGFTIVGGFKYVASDGSPDKTNDARQTIINGIVGAVIAGSVRLILEWVHTTLVDGSAGFLWF